MRFLNFYSPLCRPHCTLITLHPLLLKCYFPLSYLNNFPRQTHYLADGPGHLIIHQTTNNWQIYLYPVLQYYTPKIDHGTIHHLVHTKLQQEKAKESEPKAQASPLRIGYLLELLSLFVAQVSDKCTCRPARLVIRKLTTWLWWQVNTSMVQKLIFRSSSMKRGSQANIELSPLAGAWNWQISFNLHASTGKRPPTLLWWSERVTPSLPPVIVNQWFQFWSQSQSQSLFLSLSLFNAWCKTQGCMDTAVKGSMLSHDATIIPSLFANPLNIIFIIVKGWWNP